MRPMEKTGFELFPLLGVLRTALWVSLVAAAPLTAGCYPKTAAAPGALSAESVTRASTRWPGVTASSLSTGHDLFIAKCNGCHGYPDLTAIPDEDWPGILEKMAKKADLGAEERDAVLHYVLTSRSEPSAR
jgi:hypothetical protein